MGKLFFGLGDESVGPDGMAFVSDFPLTGNLVFFDVACDRVKVPDLKIDDVGDGL